MPTKNHGRMAQDMKRELIAIIGEMKDPRVTGGLLTVTRLDRALYSSKMKAQPMPRTSTSCWVSWTLSLTLTQSKAPQLEKRNL